MRNSGAAPVLFGVCLASAAIHQSSCFTAAPRVRVASTKAQGRRPRTSVRLSPRPNQHQHQQASSPGTPSPPTTAAGAAAAGESTAPARRRRRETVLSYRRTAAGAAATAVVGPEVKEEAPESAAAKAAQSDAAAPSTSQQLRREVAARRSRAWGLVGFPGPPGEHGLGLSSVLLGDEEEEEEEESRTAVAAAEGSGGVAVGAEDATDAALRERYRFREQSQPPPELLAAAETRAVGDGFHRAVATESQQQQQQQMATGGQGQGDGEGEGGGGVSLWASRGMLAGAAMLYGTNFGCVKLLEESVPMSLAAALRFSVALVPFVPFLKKVNPGVFRAGAEVGILNAIGYWAQSESLMTTTASKSAFICSLAVVFVPVLDALLGAKDAPEVAREKALRRAEEKERDGGVFAAMNGPWFPALLAAAGVACLELIGVEGGPNSGDVWAMVQPLCFGLGFWLTERCSRKYPDEIFGLVAAQLLTVAVLAVGWCVQAGDLPQSLASLRETVLPSSGSLAVPVSLVWTGLMTTSLTVFGETLAMKKVSAAESTIILSTEPIWGTAFAACLLGEQIGWNTGLGALLIVSACTWSSVGPALQAKLLSLVAAAAGTGTAVEAGLLDLDIDVDDLAETVGTVLKEIVKD